MQETIVWMPGNMRDKMGAVILEVWLLLGGFSILLVGQAHLERTIKKLAISMISVMKLEENKKNATMNFGIIY